MDILNEPEHNYRTGYIKIYRSIKRHWLYEKNRKRTKLEAWYDLLFKASHCDQKEAVGYDLITVKKGQIITSQERLASDWKWDRSAVRSFLNSLHLDEMLTSETTNKYTMITICNYDTYQDVRPTEQHQTNHQTNTTSTHRTNYNKLDKLEDSNLSEFSTENQTTKKPSNNKNIETFDIRKEAFRKQLYPFVISEKNKTGYPAAQVKAFFDFWSEPNKSRSKMKWEGERTWEIALRLARWDRNDFSNKPFSQKKEEVYTAPKEAIDHNLIP